MRNWELSIGFCHCILIGYRAYFNRDEEISITDHTFYIGPLIIILTFFDADQE